MFGFVGRRGRGYSYRAEILEPRMLMDSSSWWGDDEWDDWGDSGGDDIPTDTAPADPTPDTPPSTTWPAPDTQESDDPTPPPHSQPAPDTQNSTNPATNPDQNEPLEPTPWQLGEDAWDASLGALVLTTEFSIDCNTPTDYVYADQYEWDDAASQARPIRTDWSAQYHTFHRYDDIDWVYFDVPVRSEVVAETDGWDGDDTEMWLFSGNNLNSAIAYDDDGGDWLYSRIAREGHKALPAGRYFVAVADRCGDLVDGYTLRVEVRPRPDAWIDPLFDESYYLQRNPDVTAAIIAGRVSTGWDHFVMYGQFEGRQPSIYYNEAYYLAQNPDVAGAVARGSFATGWIHFQRYGEREGRHASPYFDEWQYRAANPDVDSAVRSGVMRSGLYHFLLHGRYEGRDPNPAFSTQFYLAQYADIAGAFAAGQISAYEHFVVHGQFEGRRPTAVYDEATYLAKNPDIAWAVGQHLFKSGWQHWEMWGRWEGRLAV